MEVFGAARRARRAFGGMTLALSIAFAGCAGEVGADLSPLGGTDRDGAQGQNDPFFAADPSVSSNAQPVKFRCEQPALRGTGRTAMRRLTRNEILQSLTAVLGPDIVNLDSVQAGASQIPVDSTGDLVREFENSHSYDHVEGVLVTAQAAASAVGADAAASTRVFGDCAAKADAACASRFLDAYGRRILKRPLSADRKQKLLDAFNTAGGGKAGLEFILARLLQSPEAMFHMEFPRQECATKGMEAVSASFPWNDKSAFFDGANGKQAGGVAMVTSNGWYVWQLSAEQVSADFSSLAVEVEIASKDGTAIVANVNLNDKPLLGDTTLFPGGTKLMANLSLTKGVPAKIGINVKNATADRTIELTSLRLATTAGSASACSDVPAKDGKIQLDDWSVAARLSYALSGQNPDDELLDAAAAGQLRTPEQLHKHALRLVSTPYARTQLEQIIVSWLHLDVLPTPTETIAQAAGVDANGLSEEARRELLDFALFLILDRDADAKTLMTAPVGFPRSERMAKLYGSAIANGNEPVDLPNGHGGLLLRIAPLLSGQYRTSPIGRGVYVRKHLLCDELPSPDFTIVNARTEALDESDPAKSSSRAITTEITAAPTCMGCHKAINPIGFTLEQFDPIGRPRSIEVAYNLDGVKVGEHPIDSFVTDANLEQGAPETLNNADDLIDALSEGGKVRACIAERLYAYAQLRTMSDADSCALSEVEDALRQGKSVKDAWLLSVVNEDMFYRSAAEATP
jgi:hypothetical protein